MLKLCKTCGCKKDEVEFHKDSSHKDGRASKCRICYSAWDKQRSLGRKVKIKLRDQRYRLVNADKVRIKQHEKYERNKEARKIYNKEYRLRNLDKLRQYNREYQKRNKKELTVKALLRTKKRRTEDVNYQIKLSLRARLHSAIKYNSKAASTLNLLGCTIPELRVHLESKFTDGMSWKNYGKTGWHIDHARPCDSFDLLDPEQQKACFHYTNLQPLWAYDNLKKANNYA